MSVDIATVGTRIGTAVVAHVPCCGTAATMSYLGLQFNVPHSVEAGIAAVAAVGAHESIHFLQKHFQKSPCCENEDDNVSKRLLRRIFIPASLGLTVWGGMHLIGWHDHTKHEEASSHSIPSHESSEHTKVIHYVITT